MNHSLSASDSGFPARFRAFLDAHQLNTNRLAVALHDSNPVKYRRWAAGEASPSYEGLVLIAEKYGINMNWFMLGEGPMKRGESVTPIVRADTRPGSATVSETALATELDKARKEIDELRSLLKQVLAQTVAANETAIEHSRISADTIRHFPLFGSRPPVEESQAPPRQQAYPLGFGAWESQEASRAQDGLPN